MRHDVYEGSGRWNSFHVNPKICISTFIISNFSPHTTPPDFLRFLWFCTFVTLSI